MVYATWKDELQAFEADCDRLRKARRESFPVKVLGLAPLAAIPLLGSLPGGRRLLAFAGMAISGASLLLEMDKQRDIYGGNLAIDLNPNSDYDNLAGAFRTRSPRWEALAYLYSQLDPVNLKDKLGQLDDPTAKRCLDRMLRRVQSGLTEVRSLNPNKPAYANIVMDITGEWKADVITMLDKALFRAGAVSLEDTELSENEALAALEDIQAGDAVNASDAPAGLIDDSHGRSPSTVALFNWHDLAARPDFYPHLLLLGKTGAGKTHLAEKLLSLLPGDRLIISPHVRPHEFPGVPKVGMGRDYGAIAEALAELEQEMQQRYEQYAKGIDAGRWLNVVIDEYPAIAAYCKNASGVIQVLAREARKVRIRLIILSQGAEVKTLGIEGQGSLRECFTFCRGRGFVEDHARRLKDEAIARWVASQPFPWMVEDQCADTSVLAAASAPLNQSAQGSDGSEDFDDVDLSAWLETPLMLTGWQPSPAAARVYTWMLRRQQATGQTQFTLNDLATGRCLGKNSSHSAKVLTPLLSELISGGAISSDGRAISLNL